MRQGWEIKKLGEVANVGSGNSAPQKKELFENGNYPFFRTSDVGKIRKGFIGTSVDYLNEKGVKGLKLFQKGTILFPKSGASTFLNHRVMMNVDGYVSSHLATIKAKSKIADDRFLLYYLITIDAKDLMQDIAYPSLKTSDIGLIPIPLPPLPEQQRIVAILDEAFAAIDQAMANTERNLKNAKELFDSYLLGVFEKRGDNWKVKTLGEVCSLYQGIAINAKTKHALVDKSDLPLLRIKDLRNNSEELYIDPNNYPKNALVNEEDIIYTRTGSLGLVFRGRRGVLHNNSFKIVPNHLLIKDFLFIWLQNPIFKSKILELAYKAAQPDITHAIFKLQEIAIPPIIEQNNIVKILDALSAEIKKLETVCQKKLTDLDELKKSILQKAYAGELTTTELSPL